jgi:spermidine/putrescine transport system substrate-binding protein
MTIRKIWSHQEILAAAYGLNRRDLLKTAAGAAAGMALPFVPMKSARAEIGGELQIMAWEGFQLDNEGKAWREKHGVTVDVQAIGNQDDVQAKFVAGNPPPIDLAEYNQGYDNFYIDLLKIVAPLDETKIPNYNADDIFPGFYKKNTWFRDGKLYGAPFTWGLNSLIYNPKEMAAPTSYTDLLKPELKGRIAMVDDTVATWPAAVRLAGLIDKWPNLTVAEMQHVFETLKAYRDQARVITLTYGDVISLLVSGEVVALFCGWSGVPVETAKQGVETQYVIPKEGAVMWCDAWFTPISVDNPDTAHDFINMSLDPAVQAQTSKAVTAGVVNKKALDHMDAATRALFNYDDLDGVFRDAPLYGIPPIESDTYATYSNWVDTWNEFKVG